MDNTPQDSGNESSTTQQAPADALSRTPDDLDDEASKTPTQASPEPPEKKPSALKRFFRKINLYFLLFLLMIVLIGAFTIVNYLNSQKVEPEPTVPTQQLSEDSLKDLANNDATVGSSSQTLTIQGNAIISGNTLMRGDLNVAKSIRSGGGIQGASIRVSGDANLGRTQANSLQVAQNVAIQGNTTVRALSVGGTATFSEPVTASRITATDLILSGNASLQVPNHISFTGPNPSRSIDSSVLGSGGSASVNGSDTTGTINARTGNSPKSGCFIRINFQQAFTNNPHVTIGPIGSAAGKTEHYVDRDKTGFSLCAASSPPANSNMAFDYFITN